MKLQNKVALVTGGGRGIGRGIVLALAQEGADIAIIETDTLDSAYNQYSSKHINGYDCAQDVVAEVRKLGRRAMAIQADVSQWTQTKKAVDQAVSELGQLDILVNCAGVITIGPLENIAEEEWDQTFDVNVKGTFHGCKAALPHLKDKGGSMINVASIAGKTGLGSFSLYCASKHAVVGFTHSLAKELVPVNVTVNAICPGIVWTQMWVYLATVTKQPSETLEQSYQRSVAGFIPQGRDQTAEDMGALALYFATNPNVTGQSVNVDGGFAMY